MPINFDLETLKTKFDCQIYLETGMYDPSVEGISCRKALLCNFDRVYSVEIRQDFVDNAKHIFADFIEKDKLRIIDDDSTNIGYHFHNNDDFNKRTMFFLDAHVDNQNIYNYTKRCPVFEELMAIKNLERKDHIILIDDVRLLKGPAPWGETSYGSIDFIKTIQQLILTINDNYKFTYLNGVIENDVMLAYLD